MKALPAWAGWAVLLAVGARPAPAAAQDSAPPAAPVGDASPPAREAPKPADECLAERFVILEIAPSLDAALAAEVRTDLATELEHRGVFVCEPGSTTREPAAHIQLREQGDAIVIELDDHVTAKRVARDLSLQRIPANGRALAIAIAIDELVRASWAELTLARESPPPPPGQEPPVQREEETLPVSARGAVARRREPRARLPVHLGADVGYSHAAGDFDAFSAHARASLRPGELGWFELSVGGLGALRAQGELGDVRARGASGALTLGACIRGASRLFGCTGARAGLDWITFRGVRPTMAQARTQRAATVHTSLAALLACSLGSELYLFGELTLGVLARGARATDGATTLMGVTGLLVGVNLGLGVEL